MSHYISWILLPFMSLTTLAKPPESNCKRSSSLRKSIGNSVEQLLRLLLLQFCHKHCFFSPVCAVSATSLQSREKIHLQVWCAAAFTAESCLQPDTGKHKMLSKLATQSFNILRLIARNPNFLRPKVPYFNVSRLSRQKCVN